MLPRSLPRLLTACLVGSIVVGIWAVMSLRSAMEDASSDGVTHIERMGDLAQLRLASERVVSQLRAFLLSAEPERLEEARASVGDVETALLHIRSVGFGRETTRELDAFAQTWAEFAASVESLFEARQQQTALPRVADRFQIELEPIVVRLQALLESINQAVSRDFTDTYQRAHAGNRLFLSQILLALLSALALFLGAYWFNVKRLRRISRDLAEETARKQQSLHLLDTFFKYCPLGLALLDDQCRFLRINNKTAALGGLFSNECIGKTPLETRAQWWPEMEEPVQSALAGADPEDREVVLGGLGESSVEHWLAGVFPVKDLEGRVFAVGVLFSHITDRKRMENRLRDWNERFSMAEDAANVFIWEWEWPTGKIVASPQCKAMLGLEEADPVDTVDDWQDRVHPEDRATTFEAWKHALESGKRSIQGEYRLRRKDGTYRWILSRGRLEHDDKGHPRFVAANIDITERKLANEAAARTSGLIDAVLENAPCGLALLDRDFRYIRINKALADLNQVPLEKTIGNKVGDVLPELWTRIEGYYRAVVETGQNVVHEDQDARGQYWTTTYFPVKGPQGEVLGFGAIVVDVTALKREQKQALKLAAELKASNQELERFAYIASHDLKEPLRMISTYLGLLQRQAQGLLGERELEYLGHALGGAKRLGSLIESLLQFSRLGSPRVELQPVELSGVFDEVVESLQPVIAEKKADVRLESSLPKVLGDRLQLGQLLQNLLSNALKFNKPGCNPVVRVQASSLRNETQITIEDNGVGIRQTDQGRIFEIFRRLHARNEYPGDGIGLAACKKIVDAHSGRIWVNSEPDQGAAFHFTLPLCPAMVPTAPATGPSQTLS